MCDASDFAVGVVLRQRVEKRFRPIYYASKTLNETQRNYTTTEKELLEVEPSFVYDDFEEVWESEKGIFIEMDAETNTVRWISVYIRELDDENFENANW